MALQYDQNQANIDNALTSTQLQDQTAQRSAISLDQMSPVAPITLPPTPAPSVNPDSVVSGAMAGQKTLQDYISAATPQTTEADRQNQSILDQISQLTGQSVGKDQALAQAQQTAGAPELLKQQSELAGQIAMGNASYAQLQAKEQADIAKAEATSRSAFDYVGSTGAIQRQYLAEKATKSAEIGMLAARQQAVAGNLQTALTIAQNAVNAKYGPIEDDLKVKQAQLQALQPTLNKQEKIQALALERQYQDQQQQIADKKDREKQINSIMVQAAQSGADQKTLDNIQQATTVSEAVSIAGYSLGAEFRQKVAQQEFENKIQKAQLAVSQMNAGLSRDRLNFDMAKEAYDQAVKKGGAASPVMQQSVAKANVDLVSGLTKDKGLNSAVGPNYLARFSVANQLTGVKSNFIAGVEQMRSQLNLDTLIKAKANGATFGALSDQEMQVLASAATKIGTWAIKDSNGQITGYNTSEANFRKELDRIANFAKLDYVLKGGNPEDVNIKQEPDGTYSTINSDGSITNLGN